MTNRTNMTLPSKYFNVGQQLPRITSLIHNGAKAAMWSRKKGMVRNLPTKSVVLWVVQGASANVARS